MDLFKTNNEVMAVTAHFSRSAMLPYPSAPMAFQATAYCESGITKSGVRTRPGLVAADPAVLPLGSWIHVEGPAEHQGLYQVMDTGRLIKGKIIDIYLPSLEQAVRFGRQKIRVTVLKYGPARRKPVISLN
jgi:3D (Asp-Asp-Asp) domain-containing protein